MSVPGATSTVSLEEQNEQLRQQLEHSQKMAMLGELLGATTHEFNNILMTVINFAKLGLRNRDEASRERAFTRILEAGERAAKITRSVLGSARNRPDSFAPTDLGELVRETLVLLEREMTKYRVQVDLQLPEEAPPARAIGNQIQQVLMNLLVNARQAMEMGGLLQVKLQHDPQEDALHLQVRDHGKGIPADQLPKIFDPYFTTKQGPDASGKGGTGIGLSACREIVESHQGRIRVESSVGVGTAMTIKLPVYKRCA